MLVTDVGDSLCWPPILHIEKVTENFWDWVSRKLFLCETVNKFLEKCFLEGLKGSKLELKLISLHREYC